MASLVILMESPRSGESSSFPSQSSSCNPVVEAMSFDTSPAICEYIAARFCASAAFSFGSGREANILAKWSCDHADFSPCVWITAMIAREGTMPLLSAASSLRETGSSVCLGQVVSAPIKDCSARIAAFSGRFSTKLCTAVQSACPLAIIETDGVSPSRTSSDSMPTPSLQKDFAIFLLMVEITSAAADKTRNLSCWSDCGSATAILTVSTTNFCSGESRLTAPRVAAGVVVLDQTLAGVLCAIPLKLRPKLNPKTAMPAARQEIFCTIIVTPTFLDLI